VLVSRRTLETERGIALGRHGSTRSVGYGWRVRTNRPLRSTWPPQSERVIELTGLDDGPTEPTFIDNAPEESKSIDNPPEAFTSIDNAPEEWRARFADLLLASTCCWPQLEPTDLELTGNVELGDARPDAVPAQPLWPMLFLPLTLLAPLALLATWQLVKGGSSRALRASHGGAS
jgi:hypothetical protein